MLKVLIVDDDTFTRKGVQMLMPWAAHDMEVVGEAANGREALAFLETHPVDLALVDLDMPVMNGQEFIRTAKALYPDLCFVVLTIHTEFEYIQNVLRLGAIDYIAKPQFDQENFDAILERITAAFIRKNSRRKNDSSGRWKNSRVLYPRVFALVALDSCEEYGQMADQFLLLNGLNDTPDLFEPVSGVFVFYSEQADFLFPQGFRDAALLEVSDVSELTWQELGRLLRNYKNEQLFYDYNPTPVIRRKQACELSEPVPAADSQELKRLADEWLSLNWLQDEQLFRQLKAGLKESRMKVSRLCHLLLALENVWNKSYSQIAGYVLQLPEVFHNWPDVEKWLTQAYETASLIGRTSGYSGDMVQRILAVKHYVDTHFSEAIRSDMIAEQACMSYSYFGRCFRDITGVSFNSYCTSVRLEKAKEYLLTSTMNMQEIALAVGYSDEKYFSRIFRKNTGYSPSEYRRNPVQ